jgi:hypothetical protein
VVIPLHCGHDAVNFGSRTTFILAPQDGQSKPVDATVRRFTFSTTTGFVRAWLKLWRTSNGSMLNFPMSFPSAGALVRFRKNALERVLMFARKAHAAKSKHE